MLNNSDLHKAAEEMLNKDAHDEVWKIIFPSLFIVGVNNQFKIHSYIKVHLTPKYFFAQIDLCTCVKHIASFCPFLNLTLTFYRLQKLQNLTVVWSMTEQVRSMGLFPA